MKSMPQTITNELLAYRTKVMKETGYPPTEIRLTKEQAERLEQWRQSTEISSLGRLVRSLTLDKIWGMKVIKEGQ